MLVSYTGYMCWHAKALETAAGNYEESDFIVTPPDKKHYTWGQSILNNSNSHWIYIALNLTKMADLKVWELKPVCTKSLKGRKQAPYLGTIWMIADKYTTIYSCSHPFQDKL